MSTMPPGTSGDWTKMYSAGADHKNTWISEASTLGWAPGTPLVAPCCGRTLTNPRAWRVVREHEEVQLWRHACTCGAVLTIYND